MSTLVMRPTLWLSPGMLIIYGAALDASCHKHHALQLVWPSSNSICQFEGDEVTGPFIINSNIEHQLQMQSGWVLLVEPNSELGQKLVQLLGGKDFVMIEGCSPSMLPPLSAKDDPNDLLAPLIRQLALPPLITGTPKVNDHRIQGLLHKLNECLPDQCLKPSRWRASEVAESLALSEGRFLHLFSEQLGISWRPYLLWHRVICAINALMQGASATDAAYQAGFSDSAHLSRTFKNLFGMPIRAALELFPK